MTISTIRRTSQDDTQRVQAAARRFCAAHAIQVFDDGPEAAVYAVEYTIWNNGDDHALAQAWRRCYCRALRVPYDRRITVAHGYVGRLIE